MSNNSEVKKIIEKSHNINLLIQNFTNYSEIPILDIELSLEKIRELYEELLMFKLLNNNKSSVPTFPEEANRSIDTDKKTEKHDDLNIKKEIVSETVVVEKTKPKIEIDDQKKHETAIEDSKIEKQITKSVEKVEKPTENIIAIEPKLIEFKETDSDQKYATEKTVEPDKTDEMQKISDNKESIIEKAKDTKIEDSVAKEKPSSDQKNIQKKEAKTPKRISEKSKKTYKYEKNQPSLFESQKTDEQELLKSEKNIEKSEKQIIGEQLNKDIISVNERLSQKQTNKDVSTLLKSKPIDNIKNAIGLNDKIWLINGLFNGDVDEYNNTINLINTAENQEKALDILNTSKANTENEKAMKKLSEFINRRFL
ncbi:MAG: hypothetical protein HN704_03190 [Bacteroidetes bacterium]|jgi:hypothetical protein|nr:hypothetical protein [Bacteroidota bacterium]MBT6686985.1 hypothetical protein [Bacteroidota bacterium]MBT7142413.1 hypothetical protein [Bacteroidota bacterium]MBT7490594.1 hypothetical protein [Bacteroidota bacterium]